MTDRRHHSHMLVIAWAIGIVLGHAGTVAGMQLRETITPMAQAAATPAPAAPEGFALIDLRHTICYAGLDLRSLGWDLVPYKNRGPISLHVYNGKALWQETDLIDCYSRDPGDKRLGERVATLRAELWQWRRR